MAAISISRQNKFFLLLVTLFVTTIKTVPAQPEDFQSWGMLSVSKELNDLRPKLFLGIGLL